MGFSLKCALWAFVFSTGITTSSSVPPRETAETGEMWKLTALSDEEIMEIFSVGDFASIPQKKWVLALDKSHGIHCVVIPAEHLDGTHGFMLEISKDGDDPRYPIWRRWTEGAPQKTGRAEKDRSPRPADADLWEKQCLPFMGELPDPDARHRITVYYNMKRGEK